MAFLFSDALSLITKHGNAMRDQLLLGASMTNFHSYFSLACRATRSFASAAIFFSIFAAANSALAAPPNDNFANAQVISGMSGSVNGTNVASTKETGEQAHALNRGGGSVWYKYTAAGNGVLRLTTFGSGFNTLLAVYQGTALNNLKLVAASDDQIETSVFCTCGNLRIGAKAGDIFYIAVDGFNDNGINGTDTGNLTLHFAFENAASNDNFANATSVGSEKGKLHVTTNVGASKEIGEPNHTGNAGGKSVWYKWTAPAGLQKTFAFEVSNSAVDQADPNRSVLFAIYTGTSVDNLTQVAKGQNYYYSKIVFNPIPGTVYYIAIDGRDNGTGAMTGTFTFSYGIHRSDKVPDIDGDGRADLTVFRPTTGTFYSLASITDRLNGYQWGTNGDKPLITDKNYDGKIDYTVFRPDTGIWYIDRSDSGIFEIFNWGINTDIPMYRRQLSTSGLNQGLPGVFRQSTGTWYFYTGGNPIVFNWGMNGDIPVLADFTGDGLDDLTVFRPSNGNWYILVDQNTFEFRQVQFGLNGDKPAVADYDGDGRADIAVYRPSNGTWYVLRSSDGNFQAAQFGISSDKPQPADYDGDSKADYAIYRNGTWWILQSSNLSAKAVAFGLASDIPLTAPAN